MESWVVHSSCAQILPVVDLVGRGPLDRDCMEMLFLGLIATTFRHRMQCARNRQRLPAHPL
jgi:hypothetical protein